MNKEVSILNLSYGNYVSLEDYMKLQQRIDEAIKYNKELSKLYDIGSMEYSNATTNLLILGDKEALDISQGNGNKEEE